ncbi:MAG: hypothetical protein WB036_03135, partial [Pseudolabrys sp.]
AGQSLTCCRRLEKNKPHENPLTRSPFRRPFSTGVRVFATAVVRALYHHKVVEECRPNALAGNRGSCNPNPYFVASYPSPERRRYHKRHARPQ